MFSLQKFLQIKNFRVEITSVQKFSFVVCSSNELRDWKNLPTPSVRNWLSTPPEDRVEVKKLRLHFTFIDQRHAL